MEQHCSELFLKLVLLLVAGVSVVSSQLALNPGETEVYRYINGTYAVTCKDKTGRAVRWSGPQGDIGLKGHPHVQTTSFGSSLMFESISPKDRGRYTCHAEKDTVHFDLSISRAIHFMDTAAVQTGVEGKDATLRCEVSGDPKPDINWYVAGVKPTSPKYQMLGDGLQIKNVSRNDPTNFTCTAFQVIIGLFKEKKIQLRVQHKPAFRLPVRAKVEQAWGYLHGEVNLTCDVIAEPAPTFTWHRKKKLVDGTGGKIHQEGQKSILQLFIKDKSTFGDYKCTATNKLGTLEQIISLNEGVKPQPPDMIEVKGENSDHVFFTIRGPETSKNHTPKEMMPIGYRIQYRPIEEKSDEKWKFAAHADFGKSEGDEYMLENLTADTQYEIRVATRNPAGLSDFVVLEQPVKTLTKGNDAQTWGPSTSNICLNLAATLLLFKTFTT